MNKFLGLKKLWITKLDHIGGSFLNILGLFFKGKVQNGNIFRIAKISFVDAWSKPTYQEKIRATPHTHHPHWPT